MSKILLFSDLHIHDWTYGATKLPSGRNSRLQDQADLLDEITEYAVSNEIKTVFFCGDLFHTNGSTKASVIQVAHEKFSSMRDRGLNLTFLVGNHDCQDKAGTIHCMGWLSELGRVVDSIQGWASEGQEYVASPYTESADMLRRTFDHAPPGAIVLLHQGVAGVPLGSGFVINEVFDPAIIPDHVKHVFTGHYHTHREISDKLTVLGSPMQLTWADAGDTRGFTIFDTIKKTVSLIPTKAPQFHVLEKNCVLAGVTNNFVRVNYEVEDKDTVRKELLDLGARSVEFVLAAPKHKDKKRPTIEGFNVEKLMEIFSKDLRSQELADLGMEIFNEV